MERYQEGKIYRLIDNNGFFYIGSCCVPLYKRLWNHKAKVNIGQTSRVYNHFRSVGLENMKIVLIEEFPCNNKQELLKRESEIIDEYLNNEKCLNTLLPIKEPEQKRLEKIIKRQQWRENNRERDRESVRRHQLKKRSENEAKKNSVS
jgi:hypothetical protein